MIENIVKVNMDDCEYWYAVVTKGDHSVLILCDVIGKVCCTFGGANLGICKSIKTVYNRSELYDVFMRKIGKMCKKEARGKYFSEATGFVSEREEKLFINVQMRAKLEEAKKLIDER